MTLERQQDYLEIIQNMDITSHMTAQSHREKTKFK